MTAQRRSPPPLALLALLLGLTAPGPALAAPPVLRVGVLTGAQPCSDQQNGRWSGLAVELWSHVAHQQGLAYVLSPVPTAAGLLAQLQANQLDVGVGCLTITPERVNSVRFSLPFQEMGLAVMERRTRLEAGEAVLRSLLSRELLQLLGVYLLSIALVSSLLWRCESHGSSREHALHGPRRTFAKVFQILATGPGTNTIASTTRGHGLVIVSYLIRIVTASLLVSTITVQVVQETANRPQDPLNQLADLQGRRVAARPGSVSEQLLLELNRLQRGSGPPIQIVPLPQVIDAAPLLLKQLADAVLAEDQQLRFARREAGNRQLVISLEGLQPESQAFAIAPALPQATLARINQGLSQLKRNGDVRQLQQSLLAEQ